MPMPERPDRFRCLDAYRAIGMTMVLANHAAYSTGFISRNAARTDLVGLVADVVARFDISVPMFFVLSGFLLYRPYARAALDDRANPSTRAFLRSRALRIVPAYWVALAGLAGLDAASPAFDLGVRGIAAWLGNLFVLPAFGVSTQACPAGECHVGYGITQAWSIGVEVTFYLLLPLYAAIVARFARSAADAPAAAGRLLAGAATLWCTGAAFRFAVVTTDPTWARQSLLWLPMFLDFFALGIALAVVHARFGSPGPPGPIRHMAEHPALCWTLAGGVLLAMTRLSPPAEPFGLNGAEYVTRQLAYGVGSTLWLLPALFGDQQRGLLRRVLASPPLAYLGAISLSFYLWHLALVSVAKWMTVERYADLVAVAADPPPGNPLAAVATFTGSFPTVAALAWVLSVVVAAVAHRAVERPMAALKPRVSPPSTSDPPASTPPDRP